MPEARSFLFGEAIVENLIDDAGDYVDLTGATVKLQTRVECGTITDNDATVPTPASGAVSATGIPVGQYQSRWKVTIGATVTYYPDFGWDTLTVRAVDACRTFDLFTLAISQTVFPDGEAENLVGNHRKYIVDALIDLQQKVPCLRTTHRDRRSMADTFLECGASVTDAPRGFISQVWAVTQDDCCAKRFFQPIDQDEMDRLLLDFQKCGPILEPTYYYLYDGNYINYPDYGCLYYADSSGETDSLIRPGQSFVSMKNGRLYLYPRLQSNEVLVIEWDGVKRSWRDNDEVTWDREVQDAVEHFLDHKAAYREDCDAQRMVVARGMYDDLVGKQIWQCRKERRIERKLHYFTNCCDFGNYRSRAGGSSSGGGGSGGGGDSISNFNEAIAENYTELRSEIDPTRYRAVKVLGYATAYDGGGGIFIRESNSPAQTDNDGNIVLSALSSAYYWNKWL